MIVLPKELYDKLKEDIERTRLNDKLIDECSDILKQKLIERQTNKS